MSKCLRAMLWSRKCVDLCAYAQYNFLLVYLPPGLGDNEGKYPKVCYIKRLIQLF